VVNRALMAAMRRPSNIRRAHVAALAERGRCTAPPQLRQRLIPPRRRNFSAVLLFAKSPAFRDRRSRSGGARSVANKGLARRFSFPDYRSAI
jgi:hypothetical protein